MPLITQSMSHRVYIGIGSNLDNPIEQVCWAIDALNHLPHCRLTKISTLYANPALGPKQPDFINAVIGLETDLTPWALLDQLQALEQKRHRQRTLHWGPRTLDLDILLFDEDQINESRLIIPHPELHKRAFVILPLHEIASTLILPNKIALSALAKQHQDAPMRAVACCLL